MIVLALGCSSLHPPPGVPPDAVRVGRTEDAVTAPGGEVPWSAFAGDPTVPVDPDLAVLLRPYAGKALWVDLPAQTEFWAVRRMVGSANEAGVGPVWVDAAPRGSTATEAFPMTPPPKFALASCGGPPVPVKGAEPMVTLSLQTGREGQWIVASARFVPITEQHGADVATDGLDPSCLVAPDCDALFHDAAGLAACAEGGPERVQLGGANGCFLSIAKAPEDVAQWRADLPALVQALGLGDRALQVVMPEARTRVDAVLAVVGGFVDAGLPPPAIGTSVLVEGNDGPPVCNATIRDRAGLDLAAARWLGSLHPTASVPGAPSGP